VIRNFFKMKQIIKVRFSLLCLIFVFSCAFVSGQTKLKTVDKTVCFGMHQAQNRKIDVIIVHSVFNASEGDKYDVDLVIKQFSHYHVSSHYLLGRDGTIYQLVKEKNISYHAGQSQLPDGRMGLNSCSIGIELITSTEDAPTDAQLNSLVALVKDIKNRYKIKYVLRHSDIAPDRKTDPWNLNWVDFLKRLQN